jgi:hypothetical protein
MVGSAPIRRYFMSSSRLAFWLALPALAIISLGPRPALAADDPIALDKWGRYHVNIVPYMVHANPVPGKPITWTPKVSLVFKVTSPESDDVIELQHFQGKNKWGDVQKCPLTGDSVIKKLEKGGAPGAFSLVVVTCNMDEKLAISKTGTFSVNVSYKKTSEGKLVKDLGSYTYQVKNYNGVWPGKGGPTRPFYIDHDFRMGEAWLYRNSEGQLQLWSWFKYDRDGEQVVGRARLRCTTGDKKLEFYQTPTKRTEVEYDQYPTRDKNEKITWGLWYFWTVRPDEVTGAEWLKKNPGAYRCALTQAGELSREFSFEVDDKGDVVRVACQKANTVRSLDEEALVKVTFKKNPDLKFDAKAYKSSGLYGRKWGASCPP